MSEINQNFFPDIYDYKVVNGDTFNLRIKTKEDVEVGRLYF